MIEEWEQAGGGLFNAYQLTGTGNAFGFWGMLPTVDSVGSQKYDAVLSTMLPTGDANADGIVDYADFQAVQANYGQGTPTYWARATSTTTGRRTGADLNILRQNLNPAGFTLAQFAQQAVFGEPSTVDSPTALEYDGYGVTYASNLPLSSTSGTVLLDQDSLGSRSSSAGRPTPRAGVRRQFLDHRSRWAAQYSRFDSTIGVDSAGSTASSVVFQVYGDGNLLYQSPVVGVRLRRQCRST